MTTYMEIWNRILYLTQYEPESDEIQELLAKLDEIDAAESP